MHILLTGISGFIGTDLALYLRQQGHAVAGVARHAASLDPRLKKAQIALHRIEDITAEPDWAAYLQGVDVVVHLAARVHVMHETETDPLGSFREVNVAGTRRLAEAAAEAGVQRFVYLSSIKVNGEASGAAPFQAGSPPAPLDPYAVSKYEAEQTLESICAASGMAFVIIRPPLVYGPGVKGNFARLIRLVERGIPLPLGSVDNRRSMVSLQNLTDFISVCATHPAAANQVFLVSDGDDWSTPQLITAIARHLHGRPRLFRFPVRLLTAFATLLGKRPAIERLCGSLQVDIGKNRQRLGWQAPQLPDEGVRLAVEASREERRHA